MTLDDYAALLGILSTRQEPRTRTINPKPVPGPRQRRSKRLKKARRKRVQASRRRNHLKWTPARCEVLALAILGALAHLVTVI